MSEKDEINGLFEEAENPSEQQTTKKQSPLSTFIDYAEIFIVALSLVIIIFSFFIRVCEVKGPSMENTLFQGEKLIVSNFAKFSC